VGPIWRGGLEGEPALLASAYQNSLIEAARLGAKTIAFPSISTGVYGYPQDSAAKLAVETIQNFLAAHPQVEEVRLVCFSEKSLQTHLAAMADYLS
jgi:O-acetyl-ADP-ribose deacetylase (regulator of RNase III)